MQLDEVVYFPFDDQSIVLTHGLRLRLQSGRKDDVVLPLGGKDAPYSDMVEFYGSLIRVDGQYRMWYMGRNFKTDDFKYGPLRVCYAASGHRSSSAAKTASGTTVCYTRPGCVFWGGGQLVLFYGASDETHSNSVAGGWGNCAVGRATLRKDRFASLDEGKTAGSITTRPLVGLEGRLRVNADARRGSMRVEVLDASGVVLSGFGRDQCRPITSDGSEQLVTWKQHNELPHTTGPLRLRIVWENASLFAFRAARPVRPTTARPSLEVLLDFEGVAKKALLDKRTDDGRQRVRLHNSVAVIKTPDKDISGPAAAGFTGNGSTHGAIEIRGSRRLGTHFELSARVRAAKNQRMRLFSSYRGTGGPAVGELIFDFDPKMDELRFIYNGQSIVSRKQPIHTDRYHSMKVTYDSGEVRWLLDGSVVGKGRVRPGAAHLSHDRAILRHFADPAEVADVGVLLGNDLRVGQDLEGPFVTYRHTDSSAGQYQLFGLVDDIRVKTAD